MDLTIEFLTSHGMVTTSVVPIRWLGFILVSQSKILASVQLLFLKSVSPPKKKSILSVKTTSAQHSITIADP